MNRILLLRHGENRANLTKEFSYKKTDYPLTEKGILQAHQAGEALQSRSIRAIYTSPLKRAKQTAQIIDRVLGLSPVVDEDFRELNVGELEEMPPEEKTWDLYRNVVRSWVEGHPEAAFPGGENYHQLWTRYWRGMRNAMLSYPNQTLLVVGHGGIFTLTLPDLCPGVDIINLFHNESQNASLTEINLEERDGHPHGELVSWAETDHLSGKAADLIPSTPRLGELK
jgi:2,3-bisphosphoglycerate-dependent phosphoglycerate mutase